MKNYETICLIQKAGLQKDAESAVIRPFNYMSNRQEMDGLLRLVQLVWSQMI